MRNILPEWGALVKAPVNAVLSTLEARPSSSVQAVRICADELLTELGYATRAYDLWDSLPPVQRRQRARRAASKAAFEEGRAFERAALAFELADRAGQYKRGHLHLVRTHTTR